MFLEPLVAQFTSTQPQFEDTELQKLRHSVLEVLSKLPPNEMLRPYVPKLLELCLSILNSDNQANGVLAMRMLLDLNKNLVRSNVQGFETQFSECVNFIAKVRNETAANVGHARRVLVLLEVQRRQVSLVRQVQHLMGVYCRGSDAVRMKTHESQGTCRTHSMGHLLQVYAEFQATFAEAFGPNPAKLPTDLSSTFRSLKMVAECPLPCKLR